LNYNQALKILKTITVFYQNFVITEEKAKEWALELQEYDFDGVQMNLKEHVKASKFPPTLADLLNQEGQSKRNAAYLPATADSLRNNSEDARRFLEDLGVTEANKDTEDAKEVKARLREAIERIRGELH
jgi:hypothetical protein